MNKNSKITATYLAIMIIMLIPLVVMRTVASVTDLDYTWGTFFGGGLIRVSGIALAIGAVLLFTYVFFADRISATLSFSSPLTYLPSGIVGAALIFLTVLLLKEKLPLNNSPRLLILGCVLFALLAVGHFFLNALFTEARVELRAYFSLFTVIFLSLYATYLYFEKSLPVNATNKLADQLAYLFSSIFFLYEARISLGRDKWRAYGAFGLIAALFTAYSSIPSLITYLINGEIISNSIEENILTFTLFIFITARLILLATVKEKSGSPIIDAMQEYARRREEILVESVKVHREAFAVQMTIDDLLPKEEAAEPVVAEEIELPAPDPEIIDEEPEQITLEMLLPALDEESGKEEK